MPAAAYAAVLFSAVFLSSWSWANAQESCGAEVLREDFNGYQGQYKTWTQELIKNDIPGFLPNARGFERAMVGQGNLKLEHPKGRECGLIFAAKLPKKMQAATLSFRVKFEEGYDWTKGGKMLGLCSGDCPMGCSKVAHDGGFSTRLMWRDQGRFVSYVYYPQHQEETGVTCGVDWPWQGGPTAQPGNWQQLSLFMKVNDPGQANGVSRVWLDGKEVFSRTDVLYRNDGKHLIERFIFHNYHGGKSPAFAPDHTQHMWFDDIVVREGECAGSPGGSSPSDNVNPSGDANQFVPGHKGGNHPNDGNEGNEGDEGKLNPGRRILWWR